VRTDVLDVYVFRRAGDGSAEFLQLLRTDEPLANTWHPVMGHIEAGESAPACAWRELMEEVGLGPQDASLIGLWALEQVHPFYIAGIDTIVMSPRFAAEVGLRWSPRLNHEHGRARWVHQREIDYGFMWPGQRAACREVISLILASNSPGSERVRLWPKRG
jgi:8-oxo-dGTP pyrophosphatase MutT (NUDIX family)